MSVYNLKNPAIKRLMKEAEELMHATDEYYAQPLENDLFEWHFSIRGPPNSDFEGGIYHGRIILPPDYPMTPPNIILLTPNGRFETDKKICLSISGHHPESWLPSWSIRTSLLALIGFMPTHGNGALGSLDYTPAERKDLAVKSQEFKCRDCGSIKEIFQKRMSSELATGTTASIALCNIGQKGMSKETFVSPENTSNESPSENHDFEINIRSSDEKHLLIHRHNSCASKGMPDNTSHIEKIFEVAQINAESEVVVFNSGYNLLYLVFIIFIVFALVFLVLRRIFFM